MQKNKITSRNRSVVKDGNKSSCTNHHSTTTSTSASGRIIYRTSKFESALQAKVMKKQPTSAKLNESKPSSKVLSKQSTFDPFSHKNRKKSVVSEKNTHATKSSALAVEEQQPDKEDDNGQVNVQELGTHDENAAFFESSSDNEDDNMYPSSNKMMMKENLSEEESDDQYEDDEVDSDGANASENNNEEEELEENDEGEYGEQENRQEKEEEDGFDDEYDEYDEHDAAEEIIGDEGEEEVDDNENRDSKDDDDLYTSDSSVLHETFFREQKTKKRTQSSNKQNRSIKKPKLVESSGNHKISSQAKSKKKVFSKKISKDKNSSENNASRSNYDWPVEVETSLILFYYNVQKKSGADKGLKNKGWNEVADLIFQNHNVRLEGQKCRNKMNGLQKKYQAMRLIKNCSGFSVDNDPHNARVWESLIEQNSDVKAIRDKGGEFIHYDLMDEIFNNKVFTGDHMKSPSELLTKTSHSSKEIDERSKVNPVMKKNNNNNISKSSPHSTSVLAKTPSPSQTHNSHSSSTHPPNNKNNDPPNIVRGGRGSGQKAALIISEGLNSFANQLTMSLTQLLSNNGLASNNQSNASMPAHDEAAHSSNSIGVEHHLPLSDLSYYQEKAMNIIKSDEKFKPLMSSSSQRQVLFNLLDDKFEASLFCRIPTEYQIEHLLKRIEKYKEDHDIRDEYV